MAKYKVIVSLLNVRTAPVTDFKTKNVVSQVGRDMILDLEPEVNVPDPSLGKWLKDKFNHYYWANGLVKLSNQPIVNFAPLPINLPNNFRLGIDISHHNAGPDWEGFVKAGVSFVYIKLSEGVGTPDRKANENARNAEAKSIKIGYYHFCRPDRRNGGTIVSDAKAEATQALGLMQLLPKSSLPLVMDLEDQLSWDTPLKRNEYLLWIKTFTEVIQSGMNIQPIIYSRKEYLDRKLPKEHHLGHLKLWMSYYPKNPDCNIVTIPNGWTDWAIWQYTEKGAIGKSPKIDVNILKDQSIIS